MVKKIVAGNWKMHGTRSSVAELLLGLKAGQDQFECEMLVFPPYVFLEQVEETLGDTAISWGAQDLAVATGPGAFTGEVSGEMLREFGCSHVLVGHSERRSLFGDNDDVVAKKFVAAKEYGLVPVLCVGETLAEREAGTTEQVVARQLDAVIASDVSALNDAIIAYEPVWAIGTGVSASAEQAQAVHAFIRQYIAQKDQKLGESISILYGGSVKGDNAREIFQMPDVDGGLVGGASLQAETFLRIASCNK